MTRDEFTQVVRFISGNCAVVPTEEQLEVRIPTLWEEVLNLPEKRFRAGARWLVKQHDFRFFPTVGEMLQAIDAAFNATSGVAHEGLSPARPGDHTYRMVHEPGYQAEQKRISEEAARTYFASPEYQELLKAMSVNVTVCEVVANPKKLPAKRRQGGT